MPEYKAPLRDIQFVMHEVLKADEHYKAVRGNDDVNRELVDAIIEEGAKFCQNELAPLNRNGDEEGCGFDDGVVTTPAGFKEAYVKYVEGGWPSIAAAEEHGGQGLPNSIGIVMSEMMGTSNWSWGMYPGLSHGAIKTLEEHGTDEQKEKFLTRLISGEWTGTMCLTEPHCGTDLGILRTKAEPN
ncbi:MAG: acyl-CoA dehydrogenase, partial [Gammaproteobacteria bacterium]